MTEQTTLTSSEYINRQRKEYSLYVLKSRAIPYVSDGLIAAARRILWIARDGKKHKSATLAGATMPIHPHQSPEGTVNGLAAPYLNNIPLLDGVGAFGTLLKPTAYGASRYTSVKLSEFTRDVIFRDIEIIPFMDNYDGSLEEPVHFLPLVPTVLLNAQMGRIAVGFASNILPRSLDDIVNDQIRVLTGKGSKIKEPSPTITPLNQSAFENRNGKWVFRGSYEKINTTTLKITNLPYGKVHEKYMEKLLSTLENDNLVNDVENDVVDNSKDYYNITIKFKRGVLASKSDEDIISMLGLEYTHSENLNVIDFEGDRVWSTDYISIVNEFTTWRLKWYKTRYERLASLIEVDIQRYKDVLTAIRRNVGSTVKKTQSRSELKAYLDTIGIVYVDYIADLPVYRFTEDEKKKTEIKLEEATKTLKEYKRLIRSEDARKEVFISELREIRSNHKKGKYN